MSSAIKIKATAISYKSEESLGQQCPATQKRASAFRYLGFVRPYLALGGNNISQIKKGH